MFAVLKQGFKHFFFQFIESNKFSGLCVIKLAQLKNSVNASEFSVRYVVIEYSISIAYCVKWSNTKEIMNGRISWFGITEVIHRPMKIMC